jgi:hypothetical protein
MSLGSAFQTKGLGSWLWYSMNRLMASCRLTREGKVPPFQAPPGHLGEEAFVGVQSGARGRREVEDSAGMARQPLAHIWVLVGGIVVEVHVDHLAGPGPGVRCRSESG